MSVGKTCVAVATGDKVNIYGAKKNTFKFQGNATAVAISNDEKIVAVGDDTGVVHLHDIDTFAKISTLNANKGQITTINYSPQGDLVAVGDSKSNIMVYSIADYTVFKFNKVKIETWVFHTGRVTCFSWAPDGQHAVSGSLDTSIEIWSVKEPMKHISIKSAHQESVTGVGFLSPDKVVSVGADGFIKGFELKYF